ncbi:MAG: poly-gamma-glutamate synthase PgsB, partial [Candidatus Aminicenantales bacterium]
MKQGSPPRTWYLVSAFAANDPESTRHVLSLLKEKKIFDGKRSIGLLNLRADRGDRTLQWLEALRKGFFPHFHKLVLVGEHASVLKRK